ncbi:chromosome partitioning protein ParA [Mycobacterium montefiorense]|uniref:Chromosome partitioning protein ParA n=1 Tax=Mycobacterium montefiorense TaxID=154654 RepID=A0AA37PMI5_9MYCO|nr:chromosome partitioning protein ParA [Mycobacterium montefiorense]GKU37182.1 chromosome partitioning protein ParA [Mycobacterium montefiorense]GKU43302.1 chromosome partitioning protein ParA [Mycobacterium montefiorense]GKU43964.1 chromosome partitioning protein ParA [Mycobacterium montefiorense]GKU53723.1 chromosome partitioning protein ParA [Mycobacterium montefiorense]
MPRWRADADPSAATVPEPRYPPPGRPSRLAGPPTPSRLIRARRAAAPYRRDLTLGGTALDGLSHRENAESGRRGWREVLHRVTGIDLGPGKSAAYEQALRERIGTGIGGTFPIAVLNFKGGVGKTAVVEALGSTLAEARGDRVIAVDIDAGDLAHRHGRRNPLSLADLLARDSVTHYAEIRAHTHMNSFGLEVLGLPDYGRTDWRLERPDIAKAFSILRKHYSVVLVDCVKAINSHVMDAVLPEARALVVVSGTSIDAVRKTRTTLEWLSNNGYRRLMASTVLAMNYTEPAKLDGVVSKEFEELSARVGATVVLPFDRHVHEGKELGLDRLSKESRRGYLEIAAALGDIAAGRAVGHDAPLGSWREPRLS